MLSVCVPLWNNRRRHAQELIWKIGFTKCSEVTTHLITLQILISLEMYWTTARQSDCKPTWADWWVLYRGFVVAKGREHSRIWLHYSNIPVLNHSLAYDDELIKLKSCRDHGQTSKQCYNSGWWVQSWNGRPFSSKWAEIWDGHTKFKDLNVKDMLHMPYRMVLLKL